MTSLAHPEMAPLLAASVPVDMANLQCREISEKEKEELLVVLKRNLKIFNDVPACTSKYQQKILLTDNSSFYKHQYPIAATHIPEVARKITEMETLGRIKRRLTQYTYKSFIDGCLIYTRVDVLSFIHSRWQILLYTPDLTIIIQLWAAKNTEPLRVA